VDYDAEKIHVCESGTGKSYYLYTKSLISSGYFSALLFSRDGRTLGCAGQVAKRKGRVILLEAASGKKRLDIPVPDWVMCMAFSPDSSLVATGSSNGLVCVWDATTGKLLRESPGHSASLETITFSPDGRVVASGSFDTTILLWDVTSGPTNNKPLVAVSRDQLERLWEALASTDGEAAYQAMWKLVAAGKQAVPFLRARLRPVAEIDRRRLDRMLAELESTQFGVREKTTKELEKLGDEAEPMMRTGLRESRSLELRRRLENLLQKLNRPITSPTQLQALRALEVLEHVGTAEAKQVLKSLSAGWAAARLTKQARESLRRLP